MDVKLMFLWKAYTIINLHQRAFPQQCKVDQQLPIQPYQHPQAHRLLTTQIQDYF